MISLRSLSRRLAGAALVAAAVFLLYEATVVDSRSAANGSSLDGVLRPVSFVTTAYCKGETTASGLAVRSGVAAADPKTLPLGSIVQVEGVPDEHRGIYTVLDTGPKVKGRHLDLYMWSCHEALAFGRRPAQVTILRKGWKPAAN